MAEPFAAGVWSSLMQPRVLPQRNVLARVAHAAGQHYHQLPATTSTVHAPVPRQGKQKARAVDDVGQHILGCQAWACPPSKQGVWDTDGSMRMTLMGELELPKEAKGRVRKTSEASRGRFHALVLPEAAQQRQYHASIAYLGSAQLARDYSRSSASEYPTATATETPPNEAESEDLMATTSYSAILFDSFSQMLSRKKMYSNEAALSRNFDALVKAGHFESFSALEVLEFAQGLADRIDHMCELITGRQQILNQWGQRMMYLTELIGNGASTSTSQPDSLQVDAIVARAQAYMGFFNQAKRFIAKHQETEMTFHAESQQDFDSSIFHSVLTSTVLSLYVYNNCAKLATLYMFETTYERWLRDGKGTFLVDEDLVDAFLHIPLDETLEYTTKNWTQDKVDEYFYFVVAVLNGLNQFRRAYTYINVLRDRENLEYPSSILLETCRGLMTTRKFPEDAKIIAQQLFYTIKDDTPEYSDLERQFNLHRKPPERAMEVVRSTDPAPITKSVIMEKFDVEYPRGEDGLRVSCPNFYDFHGVFHKLFEDKDYANCIEIWKDVKSHSVKPDAVFLTRVVTCYKMLWNVNGLHDVLNFIEEHRIEVDSRFYATILRHFIYRMDSDSALEVYERAVASGFVPSANMSNTLLYAFFKSGEWKKGFDLFTKLHKNGHQLNIETYNVVLQGFVFIGTPFKTITKLFDRLKEEGITPDKYTYGILMHHALIAGQWAYTDNLFQELSRMDEENKDTDKEMMIDTTLLTQMVRGYLHGGQERMAREVIQQFKERGLQPTAITHMSIARTYAASNEPGSIELAEDYVRRVMADPDKSWLVNDARRLRKDAVTMMYAPLVNARVLLGDVDGAERMVAELLKAGGKMTISISRMLLKLYGESNQVNNFLEVWVYVLNILKENSPPNPEPTQLPDRRTGGAMQSITALTDIYIRTMSKWGYHKEVVDTWKQLLALGATIDEGNWNTYAVACLRAGELDLACSVIEHVLQPNFSRGLRNHFDEPPPLDATAEEKLDKVEKRRAGPPPAPLIKESSRTRAARINAEVNRHRTELTDEEMMKQDILYPMRVLRKSGAHWRDWRPRANVFQSFLMAMLYVEDGFPIRAMEAGEVRAHDIAGEIIENRSVTEPLLTRLFALYPRTMYRLRRFRRHERHNLGGRTFRQKYIWCREKR